MQMSCWKRSCALIYRGGRKSRVYLTWMQRRISEPDRLEVAIRITYQTHKQVLPRIVLMIHPEMASKCIPVTFPFASKPPSGMALELRVPSLEGQIMCLFFDSLGEPRDV